MAIPQGRLSTDWVVTQGTYYPPEEVYKHPITNFERGPVAIEDTSEELLYQDWMLTWNPDTTMFTLTPEVGIPVDLFMVADVTFASFTFDQSARVSLTYSTTTSSYLFWYDTALAQTVTTDLGSDIITPVLYLDDKRKTQDTANDMLLWYTKLEGGGTYALYQKIQRERFLNEYEEATGLPAGHIVALGMTDKFRIQIQFRN